MTQKAIKAAVEAFKAEFEDKVEAGYFACNEHPEHVYFDADEAEDELTVSYVDGQASIFYRSEDYKAVDTYDEALTRWCDERISDYENYWRDRPSDRDFYGLHG